MIQIVERVDHRLDLPQAFEQIGGKLRPDGVVDQAGFELVDEMHLVFGAERELKLQQRRDGRHPEILVDCAHPLRDARRRVQTRRPHFSFGKKQMNAAADYHACMMGAALPHQGSRQCL
ncbi:MAG: hypothetical protein U1D55_12005 [Phycisphaerae bacterium]